MIARSGSGLGLVLSTWYLVLRPPLVLGPSLVLWSLVRGIRSGLWIGTEDEGLSTDEGPSTEYQLPSTIWRSDSADPCPRCVRRPCCSRCRCTPSARRCADRWSDRAA